MIDSLDTVQRLVKELQHRAEKNQLRGKPSKSTTDTWRMEKIPISGVNSQKSMISLSEGLFYAIAQWPAAHHTMGGLRINKDAQDIHIWGKTLSRGVMQQERSPVVSTDRTVWEGMPPRTVSFLGQVAGRNGGKSG
jgi:hypothetical protein